MRVGPSLTAKWGVWLTLMGPAGKAGTSVAITKEKTAAEAHPGASGSGAVQSRFNSCSDTSRFQTTEQYLGCKQKLRYAVTTRWESHPERANVRKGAGNPPLGDPEGAISPTLVWAVSA